MSKPGELDPLLKREGLARTDMDCHRCSELGYPNQFIAVIDHDLDGNHAIECPRCGHLHYRVVKQGRVTGDRYDSDRRTHKIDRRNVWKSETRPIISSTASAFLRDRWLQKSLDN